MKKISLFLITAVLLGFTGCDRSTNKISDCEMALLDQGKIVFYDVQSKKSIPYTAENDSIINAVYADENTLYYTVSSSGNLQLKRLDFLQNDPKPEFCADWSLTLDDCTDEIRGDASILLISEDGAYVGIMKDYSWDVYGLTGVMLYERSTGKVFEFDYEDERLADIVFYKDKIDFIRSFDMAEGEFYFYNSAGENCLTDQLDYAGHFDVDIDELADLDFYAISFAPVGDWILFSASMPWGDFGAGPYCVSTWDGERQMILEGTDITDREPEWLADGSLVFISTEQLPESNSHYDDYPDGQKPCIRLMHPDGNNKVISHATDFVVKPFEVGE